jgi:predicted membrane-bound dolichyl-phosphate-mannose-protein mannosyltransferase
LIKSSNSQTFPIGIEYAICVENYTLLSTNAHGGVTIGHPGCPTSEDDRAAAVVNTEHPALVEFGFGLIILGFLIQFFAVPEPTTIAKLRKQIKLLKKEQRGGGKNSN